MSSSNDVEEEYEVESILACKWSQKHQDVIYKIHWAGYPSSDDTWEPAANINAPEALKKWKKRAQELRRQHGQARNFAKRKGPPTEQPSSDDEKTNKGAKRSKITPIMSPPKELIVEEFIDNHVSDTDVPCKILGVTNIANTFAYLVQFRGKSPEEARLIYSEALKKKYHQLMIAYFEPKIRFFTGDLPSDREEELEEETNTSGAYEKEPDTPSATDEDECPQAPQI